MKFEIDPNTYDPIQWCVSELICLKCLTRSIHVYCKTTPLKELECEDCGETGYLICTGQELEPFMKERGND